MNDYHIRKILVCLDGSQIAEQILPYVTAQALGLRSRVVLFQSYIIPSMTVAADIQAGAAIGPDVLKKQDEILRGEVLGYLEKVAAPLREKGLEVESVAVQGMAGETIVRYSGRENIDLIAIVSHGRSGLGRVVFGSVAEYVLKQSGLPILIIKAREAKH